MGGPRLTSMLAGRWAMVAGLRTIGALPGAYATIPSWLVPAVASGQRRAQCARSGCSRSRYSLAALKWRGVLCCLTPWITCDGDWRGPCACTGRDRRHRQVHPIVRYLRQRGAQPSNPFGASQRATNRIASADSTSSLRWCQKPSTDALPSRG
jgi:hypothetical protein